MADRAAERTEELPRGTDRAPDTVTTYRDAPRSPGVLMNPYAVLHARASVQRSDSAWDLLDRLTKTYVAPGATFPAPRGPGYIVRYAVGRVGGVGPWAARA